MRARPRHSNGRVGRAARASARKAQGKVTDGVLTKGVLTDGTAPPASRATEGPAKVGTVTAGMLTDGLAVARRSQRGLVATGPVVRRILRQQTDQNSVPRIAPASLMGYKAWPFCAA